MKHQLYGIRGLPAGVAIQYVVGLPVVGDTGTNSITTCSYGFPNVCPALLALTVA